MVLVLWSSLVANPQALALARRIYLHSMLLREGLYDSGGIAGMNDAIFHFQKQRRVVAADITCST